MFFDIFSGSITSNQCRMFQNCFTIQLVKSLSQDLWVKFTVWSSTITNPRVRSITSGNIPSAQQEQQQQQQQEQQEQQQKSHPQPNNYLYR
jgi:hypothetical protein